jgi:tetratricopeptide (TPR) repeat protein
MTYLDTGKNREGIPYIRESISIQRKLGEKNLIGHGLQTLVGYYVRLGSLAEAQLYADEHLAIATDIDSPVEVVWAHGSLAAISRERGDYQQAYDYLMGDQAFIANVSSLGSVIFHHHTLASVLLSLGRYTEAKDLCLRLLEDGSPLLELKELADLHGFLGRIAMVEGNVDQAVVSWREALSLCTNQYAQQILILSALADIYLLQGDFALAQEMIHEAESIEHEVEDIREMFGGVAARIVQAKLYVRLTDFAAAKAVLCESLNQVRNLETIVPRLNTLVAASEYLAALSDVRSVQLLSLVAHHTGTPHAQRTDSANRRSALAAQFASAVCDHHWEIGKTLILDEVITELLSECVDG